MGDAQRQVALVTGAGRGIGRAIAVALARTGRHVLINYRTRRDSAEEALQQVEAAGGTGELLPFDVADSEAANRAVQGVIECHARIDILVNNAGIRSDMLMVWMKHDEWQRLLDVNLTGFFNVTQPVVKEMVLRRSGRIVSISSTSGQSGLPGQVAYAASKAGLIGATQALAKEVARRHVTVNAVAPGYIDTEMLEGLDKEAVADKVPVGRLGTAEEVASLVVFLCSDEAAYITGQVIGVNGGIY
ncbi:MAG: 3-oxoacyl-ACP reductase FabG [Candidatus Brocadiaceae bacterium]|nr:3-oxoacyl-ACP reductase FabG [Candidatus Brocadiaceae bacterium]